MRVRYVPCGHRKDCRASQRVQILVEYHLFVDRTARQSKEWQLNEHLIVAFSDENKNLAPSPRSLLRALEEAPGLSSDFLLDT